MVDYEAIAETLNEANRYDNITYAATTGWVDKDISSSTGTRSVLGIKRARAVFEQHKAVLVKAREVDDGETQRLWFAEPTVEEVLALE